MHKRIEILRIINNCMIASIILLTLFTGLGLPFGGEMVWGVLVLVGFILLSEVIQYFVRNLIIFLVCHVLAAFGTGGFVYWIFSASDKTALVIFGGVYALNVAITILGIFLIVITGISIYTRLDGKGRFYPEIFEGLLFAALLILCKITRNSDAEIFVLAGEIIWGILMVLFYNARQTIGALITFKERDFLPVEQIRKNNGVILKFSLAISTAAMFICLLLDYGKELLSAIKRALVTFFRWLFSHFSFEEVQEYESPEVQEVSGGFGALLPKDYVDDSIWQKIWNVLFWVAAVAATILIVYLVMKMIRQFYDLFNKSGVGIRDRLKQDKKEFLDPLEEMSRGTQKKDKGSRMQLFERLSYRGRVRRMFLKRIEQGSNYADVRHSNTPAELEFISLKAGYDKSGNSSMASDMKIITSGSGHGKFGHVSMTSEIEMISAAENSEAVRLYEKARYSTLPITAEDVEKIKKL